MIYRALRVVIDLRRFTFSGRDQSVRDAQPRISTCNYGFQSSSQTLKRSFMRKRIPPRVGEKRGG